MKVPISWLKEYVDITMPVEDIALGIFLEREVEQPRQRRQDGITRTAHVHDVPVRADL